MGEEVSKGDNVVRSSSSQRVTTRISSGRTLARRSKSEWGSGSKNYSATEEIVKQEQYPARGGPETAAAVKAVSVGPGGHTLGKKSTVVKMVLPGFQIDQATSLQGELSSNVGRESDEDMEEESSNVSSFSEEEDVMEVSVTVMEEICQSQSQESQNFEIVEEQVNLSKMVESVVKRFDKMRRVRAGKEVEGARLVQLNEDETMDMKRLEEIEVARMELELEKVEIRKKVIERDIKKFTVREAFTEKETLETMHKGELKKEMEALKGLMGSRESFFNLHQLLSAADE